MAERKRKSFEAVLEHFGVQRQFWNTHSVRATCPICGYRDAQFYADEEDPAVFSRAFCVGCRELFKQTKIFAFGQRAHDDEVAESTMSFRIRKMLKGAKTSVHDWNSPSLHYLKGRGISERVARSAMIFDFVKPDGPDDARWMVSLMRNAKEREFSGFVDIHATKLRQDASGTWRRDVDAVEPYRRLLRGRRVPNSIVEIGHAWGSAEEIIVGEGIENVLSFAEFEIRENGPKALRGIGLGATCGADTLSTLIIPHGTKLVGLIQDEDERGAQAVAKARQRFLRAGLKVEVILPLEGFPDLNAELLDTLNRK